jgi:hypothetical protein
MASKDSKQNINDNAPHPHELNRLFSQKKKLNHLNIGS